MNGIQDSVLFKKIYGCLVGGLIGDAMGGPTEGMHYREIEEKFGKVTRLMGYKGRPAGSATDDSALKHMLCKAIIRKGGKPDCEDWAEVWREDMDLRMFMGLVANSFHKIFVMNIPPREAGRGNQVSNTSCMCISPVGILNACDPQQAALDAYYLSQILHSGFPQDGAMAVAAAVAEAFNPNATVDSIINASKAYLPKRSEVLIGIEYAMKIARVTKNYVKFRELYYKGLEAEPWEPIVDPRPITPLEARYGSKRYMVDPRETVPVALSILYLTGCDPMETIINCANFGRDSDTIGTIAGSIVGAFKGIDAFPSDWVDTVQKVNQPDQIELSKQLYYVLVKMTQQSDKILQILKNMI